MATTPPVRVLGMIEVIGPLGPATLIGTRQRALLALLALNAGNVVAQTRLVDALWGENPPRTAVRTLQSHVARVRQALDGCGLPDVRTCTTIWPSPTPGYAGSTRPPIPSAVQWICTPAPMRWRQR